MSQFATVAQLEDRLGETIGASGQRYETATLLLQLASALIQDYTGQLFDAASVTATFDPPGKLPLFLPFVPVTAVNTVTQDDTTLTETDEFDWYENGVIARRDGVSWGTTPKTLVVAYEYGYAVVDGITQVPDGVKSVCLDVVARAVKGRPVMHRATGTADSEGNPTVLPITEHVDLVLSKENEATLDAHRLVSVA